MKKVPLDNKTNQQTDSKISGKSANTENSAEQNKLSEDQQKIQELTKDLQRTRADFENYRKQIEMQKSQLATATVQATVCKILPLIDDFDRALTAYSDQLAPLAKNFNKTLQNLHLEKINSEEGVEFNPDLHEAVSVEDKGGTTEVVSETLRPGYLYDGNILRAAMVKVKRI